MRISQSSKEGKERNLKKMLRRKEKARLGSRSDHKKKVKGYQRNNNNKNKMIKCLKIAAKLGKMLSSLLEGQSELLKEKKINFKG